MTHAEIPVPDYKAEALALVEKWAKDGTYGVRPLPRGNKAKYAAWLGSEPLAAALRGAYTAGLADRSRRPSSDEALPNITPDELQLLLHLREDQLSNVHAVVESDRERWDMGFALSDRGLLAMVSHPKGGTFHITRLGLRVLENVLVGNTSLAASAPSDEAGKLREALETIARNHDDFGTFSGTQCAEIARAALKAAKTARKM